MTTIETNNTLRDQAFIEQARAEMYRKLAVQQDWPEDRECLIRQAEQHEGKARGLLMRIWE